MITANHNLKTYLCEWKKENPELSFKETKTGVYGLTVNQNSKGIVMILVLFCQCTNVIYDWQGLFDKLCNILNDTLIMVRLTNLITA